GVGDLLALAHALANADAGLGGRADMLAARQYQAPGEWHLPNRRAVGQFLAFGRMNPARNFPDFHCVSLVCLRCAHVVLRHDTHAACSRSLAINWPGGSGLSHFQLCTVLPTSIMSMQSTGQGSTHRSQPVHSLTITVCICRAAPTMASTGQAWMHLVQPMHSASRMNATICGFSPSTASSGSGSTSSRSASAAMVASPPGGHLLILSPPAMASA